MPEYGLLNETPSNYNSYAWVIEKACNWACQIARDDSHGYTQSSTGRWGPDYDCSSFVISAYRFAGLTINANSTHDMLSGFSEALGFHHIPFTSDLQLKRGDILLRTQTHTALYLGDGLVVEAHSSETGGKYGQTGDQTGGEISIDTYSFSRTWEYVIRYGQGSNASGVTETTSTHTYVDTSGSGTVVLTNPGLSTSYGITVYNDVRNGTPNDRHDMTIREICYFSDKGTFVTGETDITISAINYTTLLGNLYDSFAQYYPNGYESDISHFKGNIYAVLDYFGNKGMNPAACAGMVACIFEWSGIGTNNKGRGICGWEGIYKRDMHQKVEDWKTNLTGQLDYLWEDLTVNYATMLKLLNNVPVTDNGARQAGYRFWVSYRYTDQPQDVDTELSSTSAIQNRAADWFNDIVITPKSSEGTSYETPTSVTIPVSTGTDYEMYSGLADVDNTVIPPSGAFNVNGRYYENAGVGPVWSPPLAMQGGVGFSDVDPNCAGGINTEFMRYSYWCNNFSHSSPQYKLGQKWIHEFDKACDRGIAMINGHYLVAMAQTFGTVGTTLKIELVNGTSFKVMIADAKSTGDSNYSSWGHIKNYGVNILEWQSVNTRNGYAVETSSNSGRNEVDVSGDWFHQQIRTITQTGQMFSFTWG